MTIPHTYGIPDHMHASIERWIDSGIKPGRFLTAIISNDLRRACHHADDSNRRCLFEYVYYFYNEAPAECWGSPEKVAAWAERFDARART